MGHWIDLDCAQGCPGRKAGGHLCEPLPGPRHVDQQSLTDDGSGALVDPVVQVLDVLCDELRTPMEPCCTGYVAGRGDEGGVEVEAEDLQARMGGGQSEAEGTPATAEVEDTVAAIRAKAQAVGEVEDLGRGPEKGAGIDDVTLPQQGCGCLTQVCEVGVGDQKDQPAPRTRPWDFSPMWASWKVGPPAGAPLLTLS